MTTRSKTKPRVQLVKATNMSLANGVCYRCNEGFTPQEQIVNSNGEIWHTQCFVCAQCFQPFQDGVFYEFDGRKYCEHDFHMLFAPCCGKCREFIIGRVIKAMNSNWHPDCFRCELCTAPLADAGFVKNAGRALCKECNNKERAKGMGKYVCHKCQSMMTFKDHNRSWAMGICDFFNNIQNIHVSPGNILVDKLYLVIDLGLFSG
ncbi:Hypothetical predicted protein [Mytilus galloprovincialis]|uniref:LIM zinc-binding domain-containing protein n=1 Tax=Mytilus galloprovincialis TaxID=29158 RepID=A0A8B6G4U2_MYTGA|nr:Hypothetical predicted protein [Mytilus galloprovincialis]